MQLIKFTTQSGGRTVYVNPAGVAAVSGVPNDAYPSTDLSLIGGRVLSVDGDVTEVAEKLGYCNQQITGSDYAAHVARFFDELSPSVMQPNLVQPGPVSSDCCGVPGEITVTPDRPDGCK